ncbi:MAG: hypothetical protein AAFR61_11135 [Bacteroidota bacterium]
MSKLSPEQVDTSLRQLEALESEAEMDGLLDEFGEHQAFLLALLMEYGEEDFNEDEQEIVLFHGIALWRCLKDGGLIQRAVTEEDLQKVEAESLHIIEETEREGLEHFLNFFQEIVPDHPQPELMKYILEEISTEEAEWIRTKNIPTMMAFLSLVLSALLVQSAT